MGHRDKALALVEDGMVSAEYLLRACLAYMSEDDVEVMLACSKLSERFNDEDETEEEGA